MTTTALVVNTSTDEAPESTYGTHVRDYCDAMDEVWDEEAKSKIRTALLERMLYAFSEFVRGSEYCEGCIAECVASMPLDRELKPLLIQV